MTRRFRFRQVDVFTDRPLAGNPLAVFPEAEGLTDGEMQALAREMNVSRDVLRAAAHARRGGGGCRLPGAHLHARRGAAVRRPPLGGHRLAARDRRVASRSPSPITHVKQELAIGVLPLTIAVGAGDPPVIGDVTMTHDTPEQLHDFDDDETEELCEALEVGPGELGWPVAAGEGASAGSAPRPRSSPRACRTSSSRSWIAP